MSDLRTAAQQALAFTMRDFASLRDFEAAKAVLHDNLRAALARQADKPQRPKCFECALDFLGTPENGELLAYIEQLEARAALAQQEEPAWMHPWPPVRAQQDEQVQEPVAWRFKAMIGLPWSLSDDGYYISCKRDQRYFVEALYTTPPQRKPLSLTDLQEALVLTNLIDRDAIDNSEEYDEGSTLAQIDELYRIIIKEQP